MSRKTANEILKVNRLVNFISFTLTCVTSVGFILIIGFTDNLFVPGMLMGVLMASVPLIWFNWLERIGWESERTQNLIIHARQNKYKELAKTSIADRRVKYGRF